MKRIVIIVVVLAVTAGASWLAYNQTSVGAVAGQETTTATTTNISRGSIQSTVSSTGSLVPEKQVALSFKTTGTVTSVNVVKGQRVEKGQILATLDTTELDTSIRQAEIALQNAETALEKSAAGASEAELSAARIAVQLAQAKLDELNATPSEEEIRSAEITVEQAKNSLWIAQSQRDVTKANPMASDASKAQADVSVTNAEFNVRQAEISYRQILAGPTEIEVLSAQSQLIQARNSLALLEAQPDPDNLISLENQVELARLNLQSAQAKLFDCELKAPIAGLLATWDVAEGDTVTGTSVGTLLNDSLYHIDISIDESEIGKLTAGQPAEITIDAFPGEILTGTVAVVDTLGTTTQGVVYYNVRVDMQSTELAVRPSLTVAVDIIAQQRENVLLVASKAIKRDSQGYYVMRQTMGGTERVNVTIGISDGTNTEVVTGLEDGDRVALNATTATSSQTNVVGGFGGPVMGGFGR